MSESLPPVRKVIAAALIGVVALVPVLWFYAEIDFARYWEEWENTRRGGAIRLILFAPIFLYAMLFGYLVRWLNRETKND